MNPRLLIGLIILVGCEPKEYSYAEKIAPMIERECITCHNPTLAEGELDLMSDSYTTLLESDSSQSEYPLVTPDNHLESYLWHKLNGSQSLAGGSGTRMPLNQDMDVGLTEEVQIWIDLGARP